MKKTIYLVIVVVCCVLVLEMNSSWASLTDGLVAYYPFNGNANDESGNGHNGIASGSVRLVADRFGNIESAYEFYGNGGIIKI